LNENDEILPPGVTCIYSANKGEKIVSSSYEYEDFDDVDDAQNGIDVDRSSDQDESGDDLDSTPLDAEDGDTFIESMPCFSDGIRTGAFANWLGSLATIEPQSFVPPTPQVTPLVKSKVADKSLLSGIRDLSDISLPTSVSDSSTSYSRDNHATPAEVAQAPLLSPMEFLLTSTPVKDVVLSVHPSKTNEPDAAILSADGALPLASADSKKNTPIIKKNVTKAGAVSSMKLLDQKVMKSSSKEAPLPKIDAKVSILKRAEESESKESVKPSSFCSTEEFDVMVRKAVASLFKQQESILVMEIQKSIRSEMHSFLLPSLNKTIAQSVEQAILKTLAASVAIQIQEASSTHLKDMIEAVKEPINDTFYSSMREFMVPAFESATKQMFGQISSTLQSGLTAYNHHNGSEDLLKVVHHMAERMDAMSKMIELLIATVNQLSNSPAASDGRSTAVYVHDPKQDLQHEILSLLNAKEYERAFTKALSISDVEFALLVCKNADLLTVLEGETPCLSQPILLCLMQQLGTNITIANIDDTKLILAWLQSIAIILDPENETIKKHVLNICAQVMENINRKLPNCDSSIRRPLQMLLQVIRGIGTI
jgi:enhancer of mRNA-decapping protein 4